MDSSPAMHNEALTSMQRGHCDKPGFLPGRPPLFASVADRHGHLENDTVVHAPTLRSRLLHGAQKQGDPLAMTKARICGSRQASELYVAKRFIALLGEPW